MVITGMPDFQVGNSSCAECCQVPEPAAAVKSDVMPLVLVPEPLRGADGPQGELRRMPAAVNGSRLAPEPLHGDAVPLDGWQQVPAPSHGARLMLAPIPGGADGPPAELASMPAALRGSMAISTTTA